MIKIKYFPGNTLLHRLDPRAKLLLVFLFIFVEVAFLDIRILILPFLASVLVYLSARIPFKEVKGTWEVLITVIVFISFFNTLFTFVGANVASPHIIIHYWIFTLTKEGIFLAIAALMRFLSLAMISVSVVMTTDPGLWAPALAKLHVPYKGAFVIDLSLRYLDVYAEDLETTMNAQMARGFKVKAKGGLFARILNTVPLLVPVSINAMLSIDDIADAMELRAFGAEKKRTWYRTVSFKRTDYASILAISLCLAIAIFLRTRFTTYWIPA